MLNFGFSGNGRMEVEVGRFLARHRVVGFCTYGEQYNAMHVNQTLVGVAIGE